MTIVLIILATFLLLPIILPQVWRLFVGAVKFWLLFILVVLSLLYYCVPPARQVMETWEPGTTMEMIND